MLRKIFNSTVYGNRLAPRFNSTGHSSATDGVSLKSYHEASDDTLEELSENLESILEDRYDDGADVSLSNGVLTVVVDKENTYVINKQTPNKQLWLSSPISGPMRFDFESGRWIEKYTKTDLKKLLSKELSTLLKNQVDC